MSERVHPLIVEKLEKYIHQKVKKMILLVSINKDCRRNEVRRTTDALLLIKMYCTKIFRSLPTVDFQPPDHLEVQHIATKKSNDTPYACFQKDLKAVLK